MAEENKTEEEIKAEETAAEEKKVAEKAAVDEIISEDEKQEQEEKAPKKVMEAMTKFDDIVEKSGSDDDSTEEVEEKAAEEKDAGEKEEEVVVEETAEEKELNAAAEALEKELEADAGKSEADRQADAAAATKADEEAKVAAEAEKKAEKFDIGLPTGEGEFDPDFVDAVNKMGQGFQDREKKFIEENYGLRAEIKFQATQRLNDFYDRKFDALGDEFTEVLGKGESEDLAPESEQFEARVKVARRVHLITETYRKLNKPIPSRTKLFDGAVSYLFKKEKNKPKAEAKTTKDLKKRAGQTVGKASQTSSAPTAAEKAKRVQDDFDKKVEDAD